MESLGEILRRLSMSRRQITYKAGDPQEEQVVLSKDTAGNEYCSVCSGVGWLRAEVAVGHPDFGKALPCDCQKTDEARLARFRRHSNLAFLANNTFGSLEPKGPKNWNEPEAQDRFESAYMASQEYAENPKGWLVLVGPSGSGKTALAAAVANRRLQLGHSALFTTVADLLDHLRATFSPNSEATYDSLFHQVREESLLILDGLGLHATTPWAQEKLLQVIDYRFMARLPTIITTNIPVLQQEDILKTRLTDPDISTILEIGVTRESKLIGLGGIPTQMTNRMSFDNFNTTGSRTNPKASQTLLEAFNLANSFSRDPQDWLVLVGPTGCGKTHLAVAIAAVQIALGKRPFFAFVPELLDHLRYTFNPSSPVAYDRLFEEIKNTPLLILDDFGSESTTPWAAEKLYQIIVQRHNARLPTVITSRYYEQGLNPAIQSRLNDVSLVGLINMNNVPDYRNSGRSTE